MEIYVVQKGDTVYKLAQRFGVPMDQIVYANQLENPAVLSVGQALIIPGPGGSVYTVKAGDTMFSIARLYGISLESLITANPQIQNPDLIQPGQRINIPRGGREITVNGYVTATPDRILNATLPYLTYLSPFSYQADARGSLTPTFSVNISLSEAYRTADLLTLTNFSDEGFSGEIAHTLFTDAGARQTLFNNLMTALRENGYYGVNLDFEYIQQSDRQNYNDFLRALADFLHPEGFILVTALAPKLSDDQQGLLYTAHDYAFHAQTADLVVLMTYEWGYTYGPPMAVAPLNMVRRVLDYAVTVIPRSKILMGVPNYGYDWSVPFVQGTAARSLTNVGAVTLAGQVGAAIEYDSEAQSPFFRYTAGGQRHEVWFEDARSLRAKMKLVEEYGLAGVSFWNLDRLFRTNFLVIEDMYTIKKVL